MDIIEGDRHQAVDVEELLKDDPDAKAAYERRVRKLESSRGRNLAGLAAVLSAVSAFVGTCFFVAG